MSGISAQGSTLSISTGTGAAKVITGISAGNPAIVTSEAHGLSNGDVVALATIVGTMSTPLNGSSRVVSNVTADTFAILDANTLALTYTSGGTATPVTYTKINGVDSYDGLDGAADDLETTDLDSAAKEFISGLVDEGKFSFNAKTLHADPGQIAVRAARASGAAKSIKLVFPDAVVATFSVLVKSVPVSGGVNAVLKRKIDMKITGAVAWS